ncbi:MAG: hypothetical protein LBH00_07505 [Planctomycetaceae bacterium]|jgi:DNA (cytosine-5)-methyltransferase 1|nr:hypothetical protein [Planctomycetaceae bacterium]
MTPSEILQLLYTEALEMVNAKTLPEFPKEITANVDILIDKIDKNKSLMSALITSCIKKITNPEQDIRLHKAEFSNGYSARGLDTDITAPFFKLHFPRYANKESAFLTMATRARIEWTKTAGQILPIRDSAVKTSFLNIIDAVENATVNPQNVIRYVFIKLYELSLTQKTVFDDTIETSDFLGIININTVLEMLEKHFACKWSSRLPVIAIYSVYEQLFKQVKRYHGKILCPLNVHTSSDKHGYGDVEIWNADNTPFEIAEIKHNIPIDRNLIFDIVKKSEGTPIKRYYILTTAKDNFVSTEEEQYIGKFVLKIQKDIGLDVIANGIQYSLKYYLRFIDGYKEFIKSYTQNLVEDANISTEVQEFHISAWREILQKYQLEG